MEEKRNYTKHCRFISKEITLHLYKGSTNIKSGGKITELSVVCAGSP